MKKNIARLGIEPQNCKMSWFETWCLSPLDHEISIEKWLIYQYINIGKSSTKPPKCPNLVLFFWARYLLFKPAQFQNFGGNIGQELRRSTLTYLLPTSILGVDIHISISKYTYEWTFHAWQLELRMEVKGMRSILERKMVRCCHSHHW